MSLGWKWFAEHMIYQDSLQDTLYICISPRADVRHYRTQGTLPQPWSQGCESRSLHQSQLLSSTCAKVWRNSLGSLWHSWLKKRVRGLMILVHLQFVVKLKQNKINKKEKETLVLMLRHTSWQGFFSETDPLSVCRKKSWSLNGDVHFSTRDYQHWVLCRSTVKMTWIRMSIWPYGVPLAHPFLG